MNDCEQNFRAINEPFSNGRSSSRLIFDFGIMLSCFCDDIDNRKVLDFGAGTGWISEWLNRMGYDVTAFDINEDVGRIVQARFECDSRTNRNLITFIPGDGHKMPFEDNSFSHICCFDTLHHMHNYPEVFKEFYRILIPGGRAIFVEPGALHSTSRETIDFIEKYKKDDPSWIERDVVMEEIHRISQDCGFNIMKIKPSILPELREYDFDSWQSFRRGNRILESDYLQTLKTFNYNSRIVFYVEKGLSKQNKRVSGNKNIDLYLKRLMQKFLRFFFGKVVKFPAIL